MCHVWMHEQDREEKQQQTNRIETTNAQPVIRTMCTTWLDIFINIIIIMAVGLRLWAHRARLKHIRLRCIHLQHLQFDLIVRRLQMHFE